MIFSVVMVVREKAYDFSDFVKKEKSHVTDLFL